MDIIQEIFSIFESRGQQTYAQEPISQIEHAIQTAMSALRHHANATLITAALLHDIGHLLPQHDKPCPQPDSDCHHELLGASFIQLYFKPEVAELIKQHVNAKRYLIATDAKYKKSLSPASLHTLQLQGGYLSASECQTFSKHPLLKDIILLRYWDEAAKVPHLKLPRLETFSSILLTSLK